MDTSRCPAVGVKGVNAARIVDWSSMASDLTFAAECCEQLVRPRDTSPAGEGAVVGRALWQAAVISYGRSFTTGRGHQGQRREPFPEVVLESLTNEQRELHTAILEERNQHVGHRVDDREQAFVNVYLTPPEHGRGVECVAAPLVTMVGPKREYAERVRDLAAYLAHHLSDGLRRGQGVVLESAKRDLDRLYEIMAAREA